MGTITLLTVLLAAAVLVVAQADGAADWVLAPLGILALVATGQLAVALLNLGCWQTMWVRGRGYCQSI